MKYNIDNLNPDDFERLVQALTKVMLGNAAISYGEGTDGGRESTYKGTAPYPNTINPWDGYWVIQAKFKKGKDKDFDWIKKTLKRELDFYHTRKTKVKKPDNYLLFTNARLSAKASTGGRDKADDLQNEFEMRYGIKNIRIIAFDDIVDLINLNRDIAITFAPFILPGDILFNLLNMRNSDERRNARTHEIISRFLEAEFKEDIQSKLDHAGKLTSDKVNLEKVFIDLETSYIGTAKSQAQTVKFVDHILSTGNKLLSDLREIDTRFVLVAGPGYGKSTLTQFLLQIYRAYFLKNIDKCPSSIDGVEYFISDFKTIIKIEPKWIRLPIKITLKDYAGWIRDKQKEHQDSLISVIDYIQYNIRKKTSSQLTAEEIEDLISNLPCLFVFDGLDEVPASSNREEVLAQINYFTSTILRRVKADSIIISTTRPKGYSKEFDGNKYLHMEILDMSAALCMIYLKRLLENIIDDLNARVEKFSILESALNDSVVSRIMKSPLQASIMAILVKSGGEPPTNKFDLFTEYFNIIFTREKQRNILPILSSFPNYVKEIHYTLGLYLQTISELSANPSATIGNEEFRSIIRHYLTSMDHRDIEIDRLSSNIWEASTDRLVFISHLQDEKIGFAIRTLQEYFAAVGYTENIQDEKLRDRINKISTNAYWSNTLLFIVGYLTKHKKYLIDFIESMCYDLNGSSEDSESQSLSSIVKMGSWLSLDILNEAIFKDNPKLENKFCHLLEPLFSIPISRKHQELFLLSDTIINKWFLVFLQTELKKDQKNITTWFAVAGLGGRGYNVSNLIESHWPNDPVFELEIIETFIDLEHYDSVVVEKALILLSGEYKKHIFEIIDGPEDFKFLMLLSESATKSQKAIILEFILLLLLNKYIWADISDICHILEIELSDDDIEIQHVINQFERELEVEIVSGFHYLIVKTKIEPNYLTTAIHDSAVDLGSLLVQKYLQFAFSPSSKNLNELVSEINKEPLNYRKNFIRLLSLSSSVLNTYFKMETMTTVNIDSLILEIDNLDEEKIHISSNSVMHYFQYRVDRLFLRATKPNLLEEFEKKYLSNVYGENELICFAYLLQWNFDKLNKNDSGGLHTRAIDYYRELLNKTNYLKNNSLNTLLSSVRMFSVMEAAQMIKVSRLGYKIHPSPPSGMLRRNQALYSATAEHVSDLLKYQILLGETPSTSLLLQHIYNSSHHPDILFVQHLPYNELLSLGASLDYFGAIILLLDPNLSAKHLDIVQDSIRLNKVSLKSYRYQHLLLFGVRMMTNEILKDQFILFLHKNVEFNSGPQSQFVELIKQHIGNKPSNINIEELEIM